MDLTGFLSELAGLPTLFVIPRADVRQRLQRVVSSPSRRSCSVLRQFFDPKFA
jgi:hypothetical protein